MGRRKEEIENTPVVHTDTPEYSTALSVIEKVGDTKVIDAQFIPQTNWDEWQEKIDRRRALVDQKKTAIMILAKQIKEDEKVLADEQERLWNEQKMPLLQILQSVSEKKE